MLNFISFHPPSQNAPSEPALATQKRSSPDTSLVFSTGPKEDQFQRKRTSVHFGSAMPPPGGGGGEDPLFRQSLGTGQYDEPIPGYDQTQALFLPDDSQQTPTNTRWRTLPAIRKKPDLLQKIDRALAEVAADIPKRQAARNQKIDHHWLYPPSDQQIAKAEHLLSEGETHKQTAKEISTKASWLTGLVSTRQVGFNNPELLDKISQAMNDITTKGYGVKKAAKKAGISPSWLIPPPIEKLTKAQQHMREGLPRNKAAQKEGIAEHWLTGVRAMIKRESASESEGNSSSTGLTKAVSRMELSQGRRRPPLSGKDALTYFKKHGTLNPKFNAQQHAEVMGHMTSQAFSNPDPVRQQKAFKMLSDYSAAYNASFPAVEHRNRELGTNLYSGTTKHSEVANDTHSISQSDSSLFSSMNTSQLFHPTVIEVLGRNMYAHYDDSGHCMGYFDEPQAKE